MLQLLIALILPLLLVVPHLHYKGLDLGSGTCPVTTCCVNSYKLKHGPIYLKAGQQHVKLGAQDSLVLNCSVLH